MQDVRWGQIGDEIVVQVPRVFVELGEGGDAELLIEQGSVQVVRRNLGSVLI